MEETNRIAANKAGPGNAAGALSFHVGRLGRAVPDLFRSATVTPSLGAGTCPVFAPKAPELISEGQRPGNPGPQSFRALKGQNSDACRPFRAGVPRSGWSRSPGRCHWADDWLHLWCEFEPAMKQRSPNQPLQVHVPKHPHHRTPHALPVLSGYNCFLVSPSKVSEG